MGVLIDASVLIKYERGRLDLEERLAHRHCESPRIRAGSRSLCRVLVR